MRIVVDIADMKVSKNPEATLITYALGSCIGVVVFDPLARVGGLLHLMLPESQIDPEKAKRSPWMFADTGIPLLFKEAYKLGAEKGRMIVKVAGGSQIMDNTGFFNIGKRNYAAMRKILWRNNVLIKAENVGGLVNRTMRLEMATGQVWLKTSGEGETEL
jgi:chemotaxis protein CheD